MALPRAFGRAVLGLALSISILPFTIAAVDPAAARLAARADAILDASDGDAARLDEARALVEQSIALDPAAPRARAIQARQVLLAGTTEEGVRPSAIGKARVILEQATELQPRDGRVFALLAHVNLQAKGDDIAQMHVWRELKNAESLDPNDPWYLYALAEYHASGRGSRDLQPELLEKAIAAGLSSRAELRAAYDILLPQYVAAGDRAKTSAAFAARAALDPKDAVLRDGHARNLVAYGGDYEDAERIAREAIAISDSAHARGTLSLALYAQWAAAARDGKAPKAVAALYRKAQANDPGGRLIPACLAEWEPLDFLFVRLAQKNITPPEMHRC